MLFTLEEIEGDLHAPVLGSVVLSSATSWTVLRLLLGDEPLFHVPAYQLVHPVEFLFYALLGIAGGLTSVAFVKLLLSIRGKFMKFPARTLWFQPAVGGLIAGLAGWLVPEVLGVGYGHVSAALNGKMAFGLMASLVVLKLVTTAAAYGTGNAGGIFGPSLFLGAMLGGAFGSAVHRFLPDYTGSVGAYALVGMGTAFAGIIRTPMTSVIMIFEITRDYSIIVPLMISNLLSFFVSYRLQREPVYEALLRQENIQLPKGARGRTPGLTVADAMTEITLEAEEQLRLPSPGARQEEDGAAAPLHVYEDTPLDAALWRLGQSGASALPVVSRRNPQQVIGLLTRDGALSAYGLGPPAPHPRQRAHEAVTAPGKLLAALVTATLVLFTFTGLFTYYYRAVRARQAQDWLREAAALVAQGQLAPAIERYRNALAVTHNPADRLALGQALVKAGRMEEAVVYLNEVLRAEPSNGPACAAMGQVYETRGDTAEALRWYRRAAYGAWVDRDAGQRLQTRFRLADLLARSGQKQQAASELLALIEEIPEDAANQKRAAATLLQIGAPKESAAAYRAVLQRNRDDMEAWLGEGHAQMALFNYEEAREAARMALRLNPHSEPAGRLLQLLDQALALDPSARGLSTSQRHARSRRLLLEALAAMEACAGPRAGDAGALNEPVSAARAALQRRSTPNEEATARNVALADDLWKARKELCGASDAGHEALALALGRAVRGFGRRDGG
ncbi:MAG: chloride channel protein [Bryobacteraceae bacterium]|nr:chloride channel protein [Bryobacteraceae bacterium]